MNRHRFVLLAGLLFAAPLCAAAEDLFADLPSIPDSTARGNGTISSGGQMARYSTRATPQAVLEAYKQALAAVGWTITGGGSGSHGGGFQATSGSKYLSVDAGGPQGTTYVSVCVWPQRPNDDHCGDD